MLSSDGDIFASLTMTVVIKADSTSNTVPKGKSELYFFFLYLSESLQKSIIVINLTQEMKRFRDKVEFIALAIHYYNYITSDKFEYKN